MGEFSAGANLLDRFLLGPKVIRQSAFELLNLIQQLQLGSCAVTVVADGLTDDVPVLLIHESLIIFAIPT